MEIIRGGMKAPVVGDWVSVASISGTGTVAVASAGLVLAIPQSVIDYCIEIEFSVQRTAGSGDARGYVFITSYQGDITASEGIIAPPFYTGYVQADGTVRSKKIKLRPSVLNPVHTATRDSEIVGFVRGVGSAADTAFAITSIQARLNYTPLQEG